MKTIIELSICPHRIMTAIKENITGEEIGTRSFIAMANC